MKEQIASYKEYADKEGGQSPLFLMYINRVEILGEVLALAKLMNDKED